MRQVVVDACVAAKWVLQEDFSDQAALLLYCEERHSPDHWMAEAVNAVWSKAQKGELSAIKAEERATALMRAPVIATPLRTLLPRAFALSVLHSVTIYDSLYVALAIARDLPLVTSDMKLIRRLSGEAQLVNRLVWLGDVKS